MTLVIDPTCSICHGSGKVMGGEEYHDCPSCRLKSRYQTRYCDKCASEKPIEGMLALKGDWNNTYHVCAECQGGAR